MCIHFRKKIYTLKFVERLYIDNLTALINKISIINIFYFKSETKMFIVIQKIQFKKKKKTKKKHFVSNIRNIFEKISSTSLLGR